MFRILKKTEYNELCEVSSTYYVVRYRRSKWCFWRSISRSVGGFGDVFDEVVRFNTMDEATAVIDRMKLGIVPDSIKTEVIHENL